MQRTSRSQQCEFKQTQRRWCGAPDRGCGGPNPQGTGKEVWLPWASLNFGSSLWQRWHRLAPKFKTSYPVRKHSLCPRQSRHWNWSRIKCGEGLLSSLDVNRKLILQHKASARSSFFTEIIRHKTLQVNQFTFSSVFTFTSALNKHLISSESVFESLGVGPLDNEWCLWVLFCYWKVKPDAAWPSKASLWLAECLGRAEFLSFGECSVPALKLLIVLGKDVDPHNKLLEQHSNI